MPFVASCANKLGGGRPINFANFVELLKPFCCVFRTTPNIDNVGIPAWITIGYSRSVYFVFRRGVTLGPKRTSAFPSRSRNLALTSLQSRRLKW